MTSSDLVALVARLRSPDARQSDSAVMEAAAAIEQLQAELSEAKAECAAMDQENTELLDSRDALRAELAAVKAREPEAWFFECWTRGKYAQFASVDIDDHSWWPVDQWITVHRTPLCLNGEKECLYDVRAQAGGK